MSEYLSRKLTEEETEILDDYTLNNPEHGRVLIEKATGLKRRVVQQYLRDTRGAVRVSGIKPSTHVDIEETVLPYMRKISENAKRCYALLRMRKEIFHENKARSSF